MIPILDRVAPVSEVTLVSCYLVIWDKRDKRDDRDGSDESEDGYQRSGGLWIVWVVMGRMGNRSCVIRDFAVVSFVFFVSRVSCYVWTSGTRETIGTGARASIILRCGVAVK